MRGWRRARDHTEPFIMLQDILQLQCGGWEDGGGAGEPVEPAGGGGEEKRSPAVSGFSIRQAPVPLTAGNGGKEAQASAYAADKGRNFSSYNRQRWEYQLKQQTKVGILVHTADKAMNISSCSRQSWEQLADTNIRQRWEYQLLHQRNLGISAHTGKTGGISYFAT